MGVQDGDHLGQTLSAGDWNGDGIDDLIAGGISKTGPARAAFLFLGGGGPQDGHVIEFNGLSMVQNLWMAVAFVGDIDGRGQDDIAIGTPGWIEPTSGEQRGRVLVYLAEEHPLPGTLPLVLDESDADLVIDVPSFQVGYPYTGNMSFFGMSVADAGDVNGDGFRDLVVGAPFSPFGNGEADTLPGYAFVFAGTNPAVWGQSLTGSGGSALTSAYVTWAILQGDASNADADDRYGWSVAGIGDVDADGYDDIAVGATRAGIVGAYNFEVGANGYADLFLGPDVDAAVPITPPAGDGAFLFGHVLAGHLDVSGDGLPDILVGCPGYSIDGNRQGAVYAWAYDSLAAAAVPATDLIPITFPTEPTTQQPYPYLEEVSLFGWSLASVGVYDPPSGEGNFEEFAVGAVLVGNSASAHVICNPLFVEPQGGRQSGRTFVVHVNRPIVGLDTAVVQALYFGDSSESNDRTRIGTSVVAGYFDDDGLLDIATCGSGYSAGGIGERGKLYVFSNPLAGP